MVSSIIATSTILQTSLRWSRHICERWVQKVVGLVTKPTELDFLMQETRSTTRKVGHSSQCHSWDLNRESPGFEAPSLLITPPLKITIIIIIIIIITISYFLKSSLIGSPYLPSADFRVSPSAVVFAGSPQVLFVVRLVIVDNVIVIGGGRVAVSRPRAFHCRRQHGWT